MCIRDSVNIMSSLRPSEIDRYLKSIAGPGAHLKSSRVLGEEPGEHDLKGYGYGTPVQLDFEVDGQLRRAVLHTVSPGPFGHEHMSDRAQALLWDHSSFNTLPRHVRSIDVGAWRTDGSAISLGDAEELFTLTEYGEGVPYATDLERISDTGKLDDTDLKRADALCDYLGEIHAVK